MYNHNIESKAEGTDPGSATDFSSWRDDQGGNDITSTSHNQIDTKIQRKALAMLLGTSIVDSNSKGLLNCE